MAETPRYWFPAKRYGWGWGPPTRWQGWVVMLAFFVLIFAAAAFVLPRRGPVAFLLCTVVLLAILLAICWLKGEPPKWRWGGDKGGQRS